MALKIRTNGRKRPLYTVAELPHKLQADFAYISVTDSSRRIVLYKGTLYDVLDTQRIHTAPRDTSPFGWRVAANSPFACWHSALSETYFSGVVFRLTDDDHCICGSFYS